MEQVSTQSLTNMSEREKSCMAKKAQPKKKQYKEHNVHKRTKNLTLQINITQHKDISQNSLVAQWLRIRLPMQGTWVRALVREDPICCGATKPVRHNYWAYALELTAATTEARAPRARAPQQEKAPQWEAHALQRRVAPARHN